MRALPDYIQGAVNFTLQATAIYTQGDLTHNSETVERGVSQASPLIPTIFHLFTDTLPEQHSATPNKITTPGNRTDPTGTPQWEPKIFADDVKFQALNEETLQRLLNIATDWEKTYGKVWITDKGHILSVEPERQNTPLTLAAENLETKTTASYLGITESARRTEPEANIYRITSTLKLAHRMRELRLHWGQPTTSEPLGIWEAHVTPKCTYALHLTRSTEELEHEGLKLENVMSMNTMEWFPPRHRERLLATEKVPTIPQRREIALTRLERRIQQRSLTLSIGEAAQTDVARIKTVRGTLQLTKKLDRGCLDKM